MKKISYSLLLFCLFSLIGAGLKAQSKTEMEEEAYDHLNNFEFAKAYESFEKLTKLYPKEIDYQFKLGISAIHFTEKKEKAIEIFLELMKKNKTYETEYYLARAYHANYKFDDALRVLEPLAKTLGDSKKKEDKALLEDVKIIINNCTNGKDLIQNMLNSDVKNIGKPVNTNEIEAVPIITADESMMIYTYQGRKSLGGKMNEAMEPDPGGVYNTDIYMTMRSGDTAWQAPVPIKALNTKANDAAIALSPDGLTLFTFLSSNVNEGDIFVSKLNGNEFSKPVPLNKNINSPDYWEGSCSISADGKRLYFTSERPQGGYGGRDIWVSEWVNDDWGPAVNLGPKINTKFDEDAPFIHPDGVTLFFSSKGHNSIGDYDIMYSTLQDSGWSSPKNMGIPLNTTEDDRYYVINSKGTVGYFSSDRATMGAKGAKDIYRVTPGIVGEKLIVGLFKGVVYGDNKPIQASIQVVKMGKNELMGPYISNKASGKYLMTLKPGFVYHVVVSADGYEPKEEDIDLETLSEYNERERDYYIYSKPFAAANPDQVKVDTVKRYTPPPPPTVAVNTPKEEPKATETPTETPAATNEPPKQETPVVKENEKPAEEKPLSPAEEKQKAEEAKKAEEVAKAEEKKAAEEAKKEAKKAAALAKAEEKKAAEEAKKAAAIAKAEEKKAIAMARAEEKRKAGEAGRNEASMPDPPLPPCSSPAPDLASIKGKSLNDPQVYRKMLEIAGNFCSDGVVFKVQIGAYRNPENYKYSNLKSLGNVKSEAFPDGITRFTQRQFNTINDAEAHRQKAIAKGQTDSWIVVYVNNKRFTLEEFIMADFNARNP